MDDEAQKRFYLEVGRRIREARTRRGLTQEVLARHVQLQRTSVVNIERGKQKLLLHTLQEFCEALRVPPAELLPPIAMAGPTDDVVNAIAEDLTDDEEAWVRSLMTDTQRSDDANPTKTHP